MNAVVMQSSIMESEWLIGLHNAHRTMTKAARSEKTAWSVLITSVGGAVETLIFSQNFLPKNPRML